MIPKTFQTRNRKVSVRKMSKSLSDELKRHGDWDDATAIIRLAPQDSDEMLQSTFFHELAHCLLEGTTKPELSENEKFVDSLGAMFHQYMQTRKGEYQ